MRGMFLRRVVTAVLTAALIPASVCSIDGFACAAEAETETTAAAGTGDYSEEELSAQNCVQGEVIVTMAAPKKTALAKKGEVSFDEEMDVERSWNFGSASSLAQTDEQEEFLEDKKLYVSQVSSEEYSTEELIQKLSKQAYVVSVEPNFYRKKMSVTEDTYSSQQWYLNGDSDFSASGTGIHYVKNAAVDQKPVIAVVDTGIDYTNEDLKDHMWQNPYPALGGVYGYDYGDNDSDPMDDDEDGHGTHCAGIIGAVTDNDTGIAGVCGDAELMALKVFDKEGESSDSAIIAAFNYIYKAQQLGVNVTAVNCSWGGGTSSAAMETLINKIGEEGALFIFASGNDGTNEDSLNAGKKECPYDMSSDYIVIVGASDMDDAAASFSNYGASTVDLFAPGTNMFSTVNRLNFVPSAYSDEQRDAYCSFYSGGESGTMPLYTPSDLNLSSRTVTYGTIEHSSEDFYGDSSSGSYYVPFQSNSRFGTEFSVYLDVSDLGLSTSDTYYIACDFSPEKSGSRTDSWTHFSRKISKSDYKTVKGKTYLRVVTATTQFTAYSGYYIDQIGISTANPDSSVIGKYDFMEGTSMAAPVITGSVAALSAMFPEDSALQRKARLLSCVRQVPSLSNKCKTGGIVDMSMFAASTAPELTSVSGTDSSAGTGAAASGTSSSTAASRTSSAVLVKKVKLNKKKAKLRYKKKLKLTAAITPANATNQKVKWSVSKSKYASVTQKGVVKAKKKGIGHKVKVYAAAKDGSGKKAVCVVKIRKAR